MRLTRRGGHRSRPLMGAAPAPGKCNTAVMTIALVIKVADGIVIAADSATTLAQMSPDGQPVVANIYNNANKVFNLHKALPIGAMTWGLGNIGESSISTLSKDLRRRFHGDDTGHKDWALQKEAYAIDEVAQRAHEFLYSERYEPVAGSGEQPESLRLGFLIAGYSSDENVPHVYMLNPGSASPEPVEVLAGETGAAWWGQPEAIARIMNGMSLDTPLALQSLGLAPAVADQAAADLMGQVRASLVAPAMPIQDAIDLACFLVDATIQFVRFSPGSPTVGGPIDVATITKHEGFRWVRRKHFFEARLNPKEEVR